MSSQQAKSLSRRYHRPTWWFERAVVRWKRRGKWVGWNSARRPSCESWCKRPPQAGGGISSPPTTLLVSRPASCLLRCNGSVSRLANSSLLSTPVRGHSNRNGGDVFLAAVVMLLLLLFVVFHFFYDLAQEKCRSKLLAPSSNCTTGTVLLSLTCGTTSIPLDLFPMPYLRLDRSCLSYPYTYFLLRWGPLARSQGQLHLASLVAPKATAAGNISIPKKANDSNYANTNDSSRGDRIRLRMALKQQLVGTREAVVNVAIGMW